MQSDRALHKIAASPLSDFEISDGVLRVYRGNGGDVVIPDCVTVIGQMAFMGCSDVETVYLHDGVEVIGEAAFTDCTGLVSVRLPDKMRELGERAFFGCSKLTCLTLPEGITRIANSLCLNCTSLDYIVIPASVTCIEDFAFGCCERLTEVTFLGNVADIAANAFTGCTRLETVICPPTLAAALRQGDSAIAEAQILASENPTPPKRAAAPVKRVPAPKKQERSFSKTEMDYGREAMLWAPGSGIGYSTRDYPESLRVACDAFEELARIEGGTPPGFSLAEKKRIMQEWEEAKRMLNLYSVERILGAGALSARKYKKYDEDYIKELEDKFWS